MRMRMRMRMSMRMRTNMRMRMLSDPRDAEHSVEDRGSQHHAVGEGGGQAVHLVGRSIGLSDCNSNEVQ